MDRNRKTTHEVLVSWLRTHGQTVFTFLYYALPGAQEDQLLELTQDVFLHTYRRYLTAKRRDKEEWKAPGTGSRMAVLTAAAQIASRYRRRVESTVAANRKDWADLEDGEHRILQSVVSLPYRERILFVLCGILNLSLHQACQVIKIPPVTAEGTMKQLGKRLERELPNTYFYQNNEDWNGLRLSAETGGLLLRMTNREGTWTTGVLQMAGNGLRRKFYLRRALLLGTIVALCTVVAVTALTRMGKGGLFRQTVIVTATQSVKAYYLAHIGFMPRLPSELPRNMHMLNTATTSDAAATGDFTASYQDDQTKASVEIEETAAANSLNLPTDALPGQEQISVDGISVLLDYSPSVYDARFQVAGLRCDVSALWPPFTAGLSKATILSVVESIITTPSRIASVPDYEEVLLHGLAQTRKGLDFTPVLPDSVGSGSLGTPSYAAGDIQSHHKQRFETFTAKYSILHQPIDVKEYWGEITVSGGSVQTAAKDYAPVEKLLVIDGHKVDLRPQGMGLFWYDSQRKIAFEVTGATSPQRELIAVMKSLMVAAN